MITIAEHAPDHVERALRARGGFVWWYVDLVDTRNGEAAVFLWSFGLPFLPGARTRPVAATRPAISFARYSQGEPTFYLLQELEEASHEGSAWRFGRSQITLSERRGTIRLRAELDLDLPVGGRLQGSLAIEGAAARPMESEGACPHHWMPIAPCAQGVLVVRGERPLVGRAYFDANASTTPLDGLGIADWRWGRVAFSDSDLVFFLCEADKAAPPVKLVMRVGADGETRIYSHLRSAWTESRRSLYGLDHPRILRLESDEGLDVRIEHRHLVDEGPFYLRFLTHGSDLRSGAIGLGSAERVVPARVDIKWQRPFVGMRRHRPGGDNSMWLPLFAGDRRGRLGRLLRHWTRGLRC